MTLGVLRVALPLALLITLAVGCAHDLPGWKVASTEHFQLYTDQTAHNYEWVLDRLEDVYGGLTASLFSANIPPTEVFLFSPTEFQELLGGLWAGMAASDVGKRGVLVMYDGWEPAFVERTAAHELAHAFIGATYRKPPVWFNEGLATYAESIKVQNGAVLFGSRHVGIADSAATGQLVPVAELFSGNWGKFHGDWEVRHYTTAWAVVHYIWHGEKKTLRPRFDAFGAALSAEAGRPGASARAWQATFPDVPLSELDGRLLDHMHEAFGQSKDSVVGFRYSHPDRMPTRLEPADMSYVDQVRQQLRKHRRAEKL